MRFVAMAAVLAAAGCLDLPAVQLAEEIPGVPSADGSGAPSAPAGDAGVEAGELDAGEVFVVSCTKDQRCNARCPSGRPCRVECIGEKSCRSVDCGDASSCDVRCDGKDACEERVVSAAGSTTIACVGDDNVQCCATQCTLNGAPKSCS
jgi:hypothetical protein